ncbi:MAG: M20/M25/M40 family metallo-hydrolase [Gammaproteobacteria bacterium]|nr:M20/M25/M40 family metallo-hydrolase [Gammaproteobacteria bacterium]
MARRFETHVAALCSHPAGRNYIEKEGLAAARAYIATQFEAYGYSVRHQEYQISGDRFANLEVTRLGTTRPDEIVIVGAHYDAVIGAPGANDNGSGIAAVLELADRFKDAEFPRSIRFVAFVNEEPPHFTQKTMGSDVYARQAAQEKEKIVAMYSLETIGFFRDEEDSQQYPPLFNLFYPRAGNFIAFVGNLRSRGLVTRSLRSFRAHASFPSEGIAAPAIIPGINWSDHWSFWKQGYPAIMITDTAPYRYPHYHSPEDTPDKVDYEKMVPLVSGIEKMLQDMLTE